MPHCVRLGPAAPRKGALQPHFHGLQTKPASVNHGHVDCDETAALIKIPLGTEVGVGPGDIVLDGDPQLSAERGIAAPPPLFGTTVVAKWLEGS